MEKNQPKKLQKLMIRPITKSRVEIWLYENAELRIEGKIIGFDEYMNTVLDEAEEVYQKKGTRRKLGRIIIKGDNISLICNISD
ncbi:small nuclear ribonucleoprotein e [Stylonychia lemnae]|uniref:Small nuclear ribonucleoprotein E n=1 Tax=Stylonychia lemnae TaxID=5949 RepID=A0A077ZU50_STYLE|nr:small nuclear ribonucleoprotein e [Stylonychia lemnae]|eukprot:CDW73402.1 small nuclear ribonucleoprotein e [Stylonychia lemnae]